MTTDEHRLLMLETKCKALEDRVKQLETHVYAQLIKSVQTDVSVGMKSKDVAEKWGVLPQFVSCVAPRKQFAPKKKTKNIH